MPHLLKNIHEKPFSDLLVFFTVIAFYSSTVFSQAGYTDRQALFVSVGFGAVNFLFAFPAIFTIDTCSLPSVYFFDIFGLIFAPLQSAVALYSCSPSHRWHGHY
jgi:Sugar (and other) transporter